MIIDIAILINVGHIEYTLLLDIAIQEKRSVVYPHDESIPKQRELKAIEKTINNHRRWIQGALADIGSVLRLRQDYDYYKLEVIRLGKRVEVLERLRSDSD